MAEMALEDIFKQHGFALARQKKHKVYRHTDGRTFVVASTPSDWRAQMNIVGDFANLVGVSKQELLNPPKIKRQRTRLEPWSQPPRTLEKEEKQPTDLTPPPPPPLFSKNDLKALKRWQKNYEQHEAKLAKQKEFIDTVLYALLRKAERLGVTDADQLYAGVQWWFVKKGWNVEWAGLALEGSDELFMVLKVGSFYLDFKNARARRETQWEIDGLKAEVLGPID